MANSATKSDRLLAKQCANGAEAPKDEVEDRQEDLQEGAHGMADQCLLILANCLMNLTRTRTANSVAMNS